MNKVFKVIWNHATQTWTAVSEISHAHGKKSASDKRKAVAAAVAAAGALMASSAAQAGVDLGGSAVNITPNGTYNGSNRNVGVNSVVVSGLSKYC
ncbi:TPA: ESPR domain-containing protein [Neisseria subflava]